MSTFEVSRDDFAAQVLESDLPVLVDFGASWCPPCKMMKPVIEELARKYERVMRIATMDTDQYPEFVMEYGVMGLPTFILFEKGQPVKRVAGYTPRDRMEAHLGPHIVK